MPKIGNEEIKSERVRNILKQAKRGPLWYYRIKDLLMNIGKDMLNPIVDSAPNWGGERPADWDEFVPEMNAQKGDIIITKRHWGAFHGTELDLQLRRRGIKNIVLCGISTNIGVESTAREAYQNGYNQIFVEDAMGAMSREEHDATVKNIFPRIGLVRKTSDVLGMLS